MYDQLPRDAWVSASITEAILAQQGPPLLVAARLGCVASTRLLCDVGTHLEIEDSKGRRPLHWAAYGGHTTVLGVLLDAGAKVNVADQEGYTAIMLAAEQSQIAAIELLLAMGADVACKNNSGQTAADIVKQSNAQMEIIELLEPGELPILIVDVDK